MWGSKWGWVAFVVTLFAFLWMFSQVQENGPGRSDGFYNWMFARSLAYDGDLDFSNDYQTCGDPLRHGFDAGAGRPANPYYIGPALVWAPLLWCSRHLIHPQPGWPASWTAGCDGPFAVSVFAVGSTVLGALTLLLLYRIARRFAGDGVAAVAAFLFVWDSPLVDYATVHVSYGHAQEAFAASLAVLLALRAAERPDARRWLVAGMAVGVGILQKPVLGALILVPFATATSTLLFRPRDLAKAYGAMGLGVLAMGLVPLACLNKYLFGSYSFVASKPALYLHLGESHPLLLLFGVRGGFFYWMPVAWIAVLGGVGTLVSRKPATKKHRVLVVASLVASAGIVHLCSAASDWEASSAFGPRRLACLLPLLVALATIGIGSIYDWLRRRRRMAVALGAVVCVCTAWTFGGTAIGQHIGKTSIEKTMSQEELYGGGAASSWAYVDRNVGALAVLPAAWFYHWRYGLPVRSYAEGTTVMGYWRAVAGSSTRLERIEPPTPVPTLPELFAKGVTRGFESAGSDVRVKEGRSSVLLVLRWPTVTDLVIEASSDGPVDLTIAQGRMFGRPWPLGHVRLDGPMTRYHVAMPPGGLSSGINEIVLESEQAPGANVLLRSIQPEDSTTYPTWHAPPPAQGARP